MNLRAVIGASMVGGIAVVLLHPAAARADDIAYLNDLKAAGFGEPRNGNAAAIESGRGVCRVFAQGASPDQVAHFFYLNGQLSTIDEARVFVSIAHSDLCP